MIEEMTPYGILARAVLLGYTYELYVNPCGFDIEELFTIGIVAVTFLMFPYIFDF